MWLKGDSPIPKAPGGKNTYCRGEFGLIAAIGSFQPELRDFWGPVGCAFSLQRIITKKEFQ